MKPARTRFAPSPTGYLHVGGVRYDITGNANFDAEELAAIAGSM